MVGRTLLNQQWQFCDQVC